MIHEAAARWTEQLAAWAIPDDILRRAPESPWGFPAHLFAHSAEAALENEDEPSPSRRRALEALEGGGAVLDVGSGAGAASLPLAPPADHIVAVDESQDMLERFRVLAERRSVSHRLVRGRWPDVAQEIAPVEVVVCHHVLYNVADIVSFVEELGRRARRRVVIELTEVHPQSDLSPLWRALHGIVRPRGPVADDALAVIRAVGFDAAIERFSRPSLWAGADRATRIAFARKRLCLGPERDEEIDRLLTTSDRRLATLWWDSSHDARRPTGFLSRCRRRGRRRH